MLELSQVILGVRDLDAATRRMEALGFAVMDGGRHPGLGTANRIISLGAAYFELLGVVDEVEARRNAYGAALLRQLAQGDRLVRWSLRTDEIERVAAERGLAVETRARRRPDGTLLTWRAAGLARSLADGWLPFFMQWNDPASFPGATPARHRNGARGVAWLELAPDDVETLQRWLGDSAPPLRIVAGVPGLRRVGIALDDGVLALPQ